MHAVTLVGSTIRVFGQVVGIFALADIQAKIQVMKELMLDDSIMNLDPMKNLMLDTKRPAHLDMARVAASGIEYTCALVGETSGLLRFATADTIATQVTVRHLDGSVHKKGVPLWQAVIGSGTIPVAFYPEKIADEYQFDGGVRSVAPLRWALRGPHGRVVTLMACSRAIPRDPKGTHPLDTSPAARFGALKGVSGIFAHTERSLDLVTDELVVQELRPAPDWPPVVVIIQGDFDAMDTQGVDPGKIRIAMAYGYGLARAQMDPRVRNNSARKFFRDLETDVAWLRSLALREQRAVSENIRSGTFKADPEPEFNNAFDKCVKIAKPLLADASYVATGPVDVRNGFGFGGDPAWISSWVAPERGWSPPLVIKIEPGETVDDDDADAVKTCAAIDAELAKVDFTIGHLSRGVPTDLYNKVTTWRNGSSPIIQSWWGNHSYEFGRSARIVSAATTLQGRRLYDDYQFFSSEAGNMPSTPGETVTARLRHGQRVDVLVPSGTELLHAYRDLFPAADDSPWSVTTAWTPPEGHIISGACLVQWHSRGETPGRLRALVTTRETASLVVSGAYFLVSDSFGQRWELDPAKLQDQVTGEGALFTVDDGEDLSYRVLLPCGDRIIHRSIRVGIGGRSEMEWQTLEPLLIDGGEFVCEAICAVQTNFTGAGDPRRGDLHAVLRARVVATGAYVLLEAVLRSDGTPVALTLIAPEDGGQGGPGTAVDGGVGIPTLMQAADGRLVLIVADASLTRYERTAAGSWAPVGKHKPIMSGVGADVPKAYILGSFQVDDGTPGDIQVLAAASDNYLKAGTHRRFRLNGTGAPESEELPPISQALPTQI